MENQIKNFVLIGRSGSGKGSQAKLLLDKWPSLDYIQSGLLFRDLAKQDTAVAKKVKKVLAEGGLPFDDLATTLWMYRIAYTTKEDQGILLDGAPRRLDEAKNLDRFLDFLERKESTLFFLIDISREEAFNRLSKRRICKKCGKLVPYVGEFKEWKACQDCGGDLETRPDDVPEAINGRLDYFDRIVTEVVKYYELDGRLLKINGEQPIEKVHEDIMSYIK